MNWRQPKYRNKKCEYEGIKFDSIREKNHYIKLKMLLNGGVIQDLQTQPKFVLLDKFECQGVKYRAVTYSPDFGYTQDGKKILVDVKSPITRKEPRYIIKKKMFLSKYGEEFIFIEV